MNTEPEKYPLFSSFPLKEEDLSIATTFNELQLANFANMRVDVAKALLYLPFTPNSPVDYAQQEAFLSGKLEVLDLLLS